MAVLQKFSENQKDFLLYQKRLDAERVEATWKTLLEQERREKEHEREEKEVERREEERLLALLRKAGIDPEQS